MSGGPFGLPLGAVRSALDIAEWAAGGPEPSGSDGAADEWSAEVTSLIAAQARISALLAKMVEQQSDGSRTRREVFALLREEIEVLGARDDLASLDERGPFDEP